ncbi:unnamed protein product [Pedinophyceae sp. YPF-701]|nr:unnamed protein product [Pedinophyceae sp. YPF-701]
MPSEREVTEESADDAALYTNRCRARLRLEEIEGARSAVAKSIARLSLDLFLSGDTEAFRYGDVIEVRDAGDDAWLGGPAPHNPALDGPDGAGGFKQLCDGSAEKPAGVADFAWRKKLSFRTLAEAVAAADDGDRIVLLPGTHNGCGKTVEVDKLVHIAGSADGGATVYDHRANCPALHITHDCVLSNLTVDMTGFREGVLVENRCRVAIDRCVFRCANDACVDVGGHAHVQLGACDLCGRVGLRAFGDAKVAVRRCVFEKNRSQGLWVGEDATVSVDDSVLNDNGEEGVAVLGSATVTISRSCIGDNGAPCVDASGAAKVQLSDTQLGGSKATCACAAWERAAVTASRCVLEGGKSAGLLVHGDDVRMSVTDSRIQGGIEAPEAVRSSLLDDRARNDLLGNSRAARLPPDLGPFAEPVGAV